MVSESSKEITFGIILLCGIVGAIIINRKNKDSRKDSLDSNLSDTNADILTSGSSFLHSTTPTAHFDSHGPVDHCSGDIGSDSGDCSGGDGGGD